MMNYTRDPVLVVGDEYVILPAAFVHEYRLQDATPPAVDPTSRAPILDCSSLLVADEPEQLKGNIVKGKDFISVRADVWDKWALTSGVTIAGPPPVRRTVQKVVSRTGHDISPELFIVDVHLFRVSLKLPVAGALGAVDAATVAAQPRTVLATMGASPRTVLVDFHKAWDKSAQAAGAPLPPGLSRYRLWLPVPGAPEKRALFASTSDRLESVSTAVCAARQIADTALLPRFSELEVEVRASSGEWPYGDMTRLSLAANAAPASWTSEDLDPGNLTANLCFFSKTDDPDTLYEAEVLPKKSAYFVDCVSLRQMWDVRGFQTMYALPTNREVKEGKLKSPRLAEGKAWFRSSLRVGSEVEIICQNASWNLLWVKTMDHTVFPAKFTVYDKDLDLQLEYPYFAPPGTHITPDRLQVLRTRKRPPSQDPEKFPVNPNIPLDGPPLMASPPAPLHPSCCIPEFPVTKLSHSTMSDPAVVSKQKTRQGGYFGSDDTEEETPLSELRAKRGSAVRPRGTAPDAETRTAYDDFITSKMALYNSKEKQFSNYNTYYSSSVDYARGGGPDCAVVGLKNLGNTCFMNSILQVRKACRGCDAPTVVFATAI